MTNYLTFKQATTIFFPVLVHIVSPLLLRLYNGNTAEQYFKIVAKWNHGASHSISERVCSSSRHRSHTKWHLLYAYITSVMFSLAVQRPCLRAASLNVAGTCCSVFERYVTPRWRDLWHNRLANPRNPAQSWATALSPAALPLRCKQHCVCHLQFGERTFCPTDLVCSWQHFFCFLSGDEESCPFSFNKQTAVWINKLKGSGCGPVRTVCSVSLPVCLSCGLVKGAPCPNCTGMKRAHNGLLHVNSLVVFSPAFVFRSSLGWLTK